MASAVQINLTQKGVNVKVAGEIASKQMNMCKMYIELFTAYGQALCESTGREVPPKEVMAYMKESSGGFLDFEMWRDRVGLNFMGGEMTSGFAWGVSTVEWTLPQRPSSSGGGSASGEGGGSASGEGDGSARPRGAPARRVGSSRRGR